MQTTPQATPIEQPSAATANPNTATALRPPLWQRIVKESLIVVVLISVGGFFLTYVLGVQLPGLASAKDDSKDAKESKDAKDKKDSQIPPGVTLVKDKAHTVDVVEETRTSLGFRKGVNDLFAVAQVPTRMKPLQLPGSTALDPTHLARIRARFTPTRVVKIGELHDLSPKTGRTEFRELRPGDHVKKGEILGLFYSEIVGSKKNDLLDALVQLELDQKILDQAELQRAALPQVFMDTAFRAVQGDRNTISRAYNNLQLWDIPQDEIDALQVEAKLISADKTAWLRTPEGRWVNGERQKDGNPLENPWGKVTLRAPFDGVIVERNLHVDEMVIDNTVNLFQVADVNRLLVIANCPEDQLPVLEALGYGAKWSVRTVGAEAGNGLPGNIEEIGYVIDPNQHTAVIKGYVQNPGQKLRAGQYVATTVPIPPPPGVVEIPMNALVDDGKQSLVFVQTDPTKPQYTMRRVQITHRFDKTAFVRSTPIPKNEQLTAKEEEEGLLPKEPLLPGDRVLPTGALELKLALLTLESQSKKEPKEEKMP